MHSESPFALGQVLLIDKPLGWTSFDVVRKLRHLIRIKKIGHAGTLDPLATGLLIVCTGKFTKRINEFMAQEKEYTGTITLGAVTPSYDLETEPTNHQDIGAITLSLIQQSVKQFTGSILQVPPAHSAIKVKGKRVYELARKGESVVLEPRRITISSFEVLRFEEGLVHFKVVCSTGTYIRSLANDLGVALGCGAYLSALRRTRIGSFLVDQAQTPEQFERSLPVQ
ncbi:MAG TPA: tRNA pseudouridine(55) synthase TruB [Chitinophagaceae bacterium]|nr:tRNA pseudouridine(55) synthase TruB [Chitinophagaceae bacterium]